MANGKPQIRKSAVLRPFHNKNRRLDQSCVWTNICTSSQFNHSTFSPYVLVTLMSVQSNTKKLVFERTLRTEGHWLTGANRLISSFIKCVICCKTKRSLEVLKTIYVPTDMIIPETPFKSVA